MFWKWQPTPVLLPGKFHRLQQGHPCHLLPRPVTPGGRVCCVHFNHETWERHRDAVPKKTSPRPKPRSQGLGSHLEKGSLQI